MIDYDVWIPILIKLVILIVKSNMLANSNAPVFITVSEAVINANAILYIQPPNGPSKAMIYLMGGQVLEIEEAAYKELISKLPIKQLPEKISMSGHNFDD